MSVYINGFYHNQFIVCTSDKGPDVRTRIPRKGAIGIITGYDSWDGKLCVEWEAGSFAPLISEEDDYARQSWVPYSCVAPYIAEPERDEAGHRICPDCGCIIEDDDETMFYVSSQKKWICKHCYETNYAKCPICGAVEPKGWLIELDYSEYYGHIVRARICKTCLEDASRFYKCADCGRWFDECVNEGVGIRGGIVCPECSANYELCPRCHVMTPRSELAHVPGYDGHVCPDCQFKIKRNAINPYSYKPSPKFKVGSTHDQFDTDASITELLMGVELEIDKGEDDAGCANEIVTTCPDVYCKHDGSLAHGVEIVSHPCTLDYHLNELGWDKIVEIARRYDFKSHNAKTCGLHVHIGRRQLGTNDAERDKTAGKLVLLMKRHWDNMVKFSRRLESQLNWAKCNKPKLDEARDENSLIDVALDTEEDGRYQAVNLCNEKTVEIRLFRGTLELNTIKATLEMVQNMCMYCKEHTGLEVMNSQWGDIAYYHAYPELYDYLTERGLSAAQMDMFTQLPAWEFAPPPPPPVRTVVSTTLLTDDIPEVTAGILNRPYACDIHDFRVGDYVLVVDGHSYWGEENAPVGHIGRVVEVRCEDCGIAFNYTAAPFHSLNGRLNTTSGYYLHPCNLARYDGPHPEIDLNGNIDRTVNTIRDYRDVTSTMVCSV